LKTATAWTRTSVKATLARSMRLVPTPWVGTHVFATLATGVTATLANLANGAHTRTSPEQPNARFVRRVPMPTKKACQGALSARQASLTTRWEWKIAQRRAKSVRRANFHQVQVLIDAHRVPEASIARAKATRRVLSAPREHTMPFRVARARRQRFAHPARRESLLPALERPGATSAEKESTRTSKVK
jgi:hypothetical protein